MSLLRYSARRRHKQCSGNSDDGSDSIDPISLDRLDGLVVRLGNVCFDPQLISMALRRFKRHPVTNEYVLLVVRNRIHGFANQPPEDIDVLDIATGFVRDNVLGKGEYLRKELERMERNIVDISRVFSAEFFKFVSESMLVDPAADAEHMRRYFASELRGMVKIRRAVLEMTRFERLSVQRAVTPAEIISFSTKVFRIRYEANKLMRNALRLGVTIQLKDAEERESVRERLRESENLVEHAELIGFV